MVDNLRVLQLIDSLDSGGAEKMAVNYANAFSEKFGASFLCCSRKEGILKNKLHTKVEYLFLGKKISMDPLAFFRLHKFVNKNGINVVQAHSTSFFLGVIIKLMNPQKIKLIWHDHYGKDLFKRPSGILKIASVFFDGIITVNQNLKEWNIKHLKTKKIKYIPNFVVSAQPLKNMDFELRGKGGFKIICVANFRQQKDHFNLLKAFMILLESHPDINLHLMGKLVDMEYYKKVESFIFQNDINDKVFIYNEEGNVEEKLLYADVGVLSSLSEGLPVALLEYGKAGLPVVCTDVGQCSEVIKGTGMIVPPGNHDLLANAIAYYIQNKKKRIQDAKVFQERVHQEFSKENVINSAVDFFSEMRGNGE